MPVGRPVLITANDHELRLYNGDAGVAVADGDRVRVAFERRGGVLMVSPARLESVETLYAMTLHKARGSQVETAAVLLPAPESQILTPARIGNAASAFATLTQRASQFLS